VAVGVALVIGAATGARVWLHRRVPGVDAPPRAVTADYRLAVLAYERVAASARGLAPSRLAEHLEALRAAGFHPVSLRQVHDAYRRGAPLPDHPILITFDGGHLSTYEAADPLLRRLRWPAVVFVDPRRQEERHATYVYWDRLQRMVDSGVWDVGTIGPWPDAARAVERHLGPYRVLGAAGRSGAGAGAGGVDAPPLAFENAWFGVNAPEADPARLARVRVQPGWSGRELVERLRASLSAPGLDPRGEPPAVGAAGWSCSIGRLDVSGDAVTLTGAPRAEAWLAGTEWARDFVLEAEVRADAGPFWLVQQAVGARDAWRWGGNARALYLQRVRPGSRIDVLARSDGGSGPGGWHTVRVVKRGDGVWVQWDGAATERLPRAVGARWRGYVGFSTGGPGEPGRLSLRRVRFAAIPYAVRAVSASPSRRETRALLADAPRVAGISPPGLVQRGETLERRVVDAQLLTMLAARGAWDVVPSVELDGRAAADPARAAEIADVAADEGWAGVRVVLRDLGPRARAAWDHAAPGWRRLFERRGLRLVIDQEPGSAS
jgi:hypothetical protein